MGAHLRHRDREAVMQPIHYRQPTILEPRDYVEYLSEDERPPTHLLRIIPRKKSQMVDSDAISNQQAVLFDSAESLTFCE